MALQNGHATESQNPRSAERDVARDSETTPLLRRSEEKYSKFSGRQKTFIVLIAALASTFSPLSSNIYYPAINSIARELNVTMEMMNLTITAYMVRTTLLSQPSSVWNSKTAVLNYGF